ncbi:MAG: hypothetical protein F6K25_30125 [Okeania sp. SIO2G4]|uniref:hypothetical protein n=1 Tax=unclassified Okeania TaxID=2634635 RepID=UPI0013B811D3|nr:MULTISPECIES: hypothetical protein [unclassified Okeania]NEP06188.1 hypothetical protein [Okeania sp. SIO4D6]NEP75839.1 hypothetical protein [Okeania sp. SIO2G5]NEP97007.1 hypothetical protein [Okeania sp. SIO2F5]NEQ94665.1 hypothetical protein [Okeania sp. SIO2G4]
MAVAMFVIPIKTVNAAPMIEFTDSQQALGNSFSFGVSLADVDGDGDVDAFVANFVDKSIAGLSLGSTIV